MLDDPVIAPSALKHGLSEDEIRHAYHNPVRIWDLGEGFMLIVGPDPAAAFLEVSSTSRASRRTSSCTPCDPGSSA